MRSSGSTERMIGDAELLVFRRDHYSLFVRLFWREPTTDLLTGLNEGLEERTRGAEGLHPLLGKGWEEIGAYLAEHEPIDLAEDAADEFTRLFLGPMAPEVHPYESYYLTGKLFDRPLVAVRGFLQKVGVERREDYPEPEDSLAFELEVMRQLIARQRAEQNPDGEARWVHLQAAFLKQHLLVWAPACARDLEEARGARLYRGVARLLRGFLELELELFRDWGPLPLRSLEEARLSYGQLGGWKGPIFQAPPGVETPEDPGPTLPPDQSGRTK